MKDSGKSLSISLPAIFLGVRLMMIIAIPIDGLRGYSDLAHFYNLARMGWPYLDFGLNILQYFRFVHSYIFHRSRARTNL